MLAYSCVPEIINLIENHLFGGIFLPSILVTTNPCYPATISPSLVLNRTELIEIPYLSAGHYRGFSVCFWRDSPQWARASSFTRFLDHTQRSTTVGRTPLGEWSARRRDLYLTTHTLTTDKIPYLPVGSEPTISAGERPQTYALDRAATGTGRYGGLLRIYWIRNRGQPARGGPPAWGLGDVKKSCYKSFTKASDLD